MSPQLEIIHHPGGAAVVAIDAARRVCLCASSGTPPAAGSGSCRPASSSRGAAAGDRAARTERGGRHRAPSTGRAWAAYVSSPGVFTEIVHLFLARELDSVKMAHEAGELIEVHWVDLEEACARALSGDIR